MINFPLMWLMLCSACLGHYSKDPYQRTFFMKADPRCPPQTGRISLSCLIDAKKEAKKFLVSRHQMYLLVKVTWASQGLVTLLFISVPIVVIAQIVLSSHFFRKGKTHVINVEWNVMLNFEWKAFIIYYRINWS